MLKAEEEMMGTLIQDLRYGWRGLWKSRGFTSVAVLSLALGIGANTAIFSLVNAVLLKPLAYSNPESLVMVWEDATSAGFPRNQPAPANFNDWRAQNQTFESMAALDWREFNLTGVVRPERVIAYGVTADFFRLLGVNPLLGRTFQLDEDAPGANRVVVISHKFWQNRFGGDRGIIGTEILLDGVGHKVIGVMPAGFQFIKDFIDLWVPLGMSQQELADRSSNYLLVVGRVRPGVSIERADSDIKTIQQRIARDYPNEAGKLSAYVLPLREELAGDVNRPLILLLAAVGFVLLIACANVANLLLARAASRQKEIAIRTSVGASRWRILRQLLTESILLSIVGAIIGLLFAVASFSFLEKMIPEGMALTTKLTIDAKVLGYSLLVSLITGMIFGLAPALQASKPDLNRTLKQAGRSSGFGVGGNLLRNAMVVAEIALALVLLVGAGLLIQTFYKLRSQYSGIRPENLIRLQTSLPKQKNADHAMSTFFYDRVLERVKGLPGVVSAGYTTTVPLAWKGGTSAIAIEGRSEKELKAEGLSSDANHRQVSADYLQTMGITLRGGRFFNESDTAQSMPVAIINETMARQYWPNGAIGAIGANDTGVNRDALGKRIKVNDPHMESEWMTIVGIVADVKQMGLDAPVNAEMYIPYRQFKTHEWFRPRDLVLRTSIDPTKIVPSVRREVQAVDPDQPVSDVSTMGEILDEETALRQMGMTLLTVFAGLALVLATLGTYGVLSYFVTQHMVEIGVRVALGAQPRDILGLVIKRGMRLAMIGVLIGLTAAFALMRLISGLLYGVNASDPITFGGVGLLLTAVAFLACYIPARRATKVDPKIALKYD
jgi:putative ABC transport system permease protein